MTDLPSTSPLISVIMPVYNREKFVPEAIESILKQSLADFEFIIIDDCSTDSSKDVMLTYARSDPRIRLIFNETNQGIVNSTNRGLELARGEFIALMDSDDISLPQRFKAQIDFLQQNPDIVAVGSNVIEIDPDGNHIKTTTYPMTPGQIRWGLLFKCVMVNPTVMFRRRVFRELGFAYKCIPSAQDYDLWVQISKHYNLANIREPLLYYRRHTQNITTTGRKAQLHHSDEIIQAQVKELTGIHLPIELLPGYLTVKKIRNTEDAIFLTRIFILAQKNALRWNITAAEKQYIRRQTAKKLRAIWHSQNRPLQLLPFVFYSAAIDLAGLFKRFSNHETGD